MSMLAQAENKTRKKQGASGGGGDGVAAAAGGGGGGATPAGLAEEARRRYLNYALSVITSRALPDVRDGLKPVQRRILYGMWNDLNLSHDAKYQKCAQVVGAIMGRYHPHGDSAIYDALVRMAQDFSLRYPLVDGHGNFGSLDGDSAAAYRYTECRLEKLADELLNELEPEDGRLPPQLRRHPPGAHRPARARAASADERHHGHRRGHGHQHPAPPPGRAGRRAASSSSTTPSSRPRSSSSASRARTSPPAARSSTPRRSCARSTRPARARVRVRGEYKLEELKRGGQQIVITSIPYAVNKSTLVAKIGDIVRERKLPLVVDVRDESTKDVRIVLELKKEARPRAGDGVPLQEHAAADELQRQPHLPRPQRGEPRGRHAAAAGPQGDPPYFLDFRLDVIKRRPSTSSTS